MTPSILVIILFMALFLGIFGLTMLAFLVSLLGRLFFRTRDFINVHVLNRAT